jgi:hypothetical protein
LYVYPLIPKCNFTFFEERIVCVTFSTLCCSFPEIVSK